MIRVLIVDDHAFVRAQITRVMSEATGIVVVGECADGAEVPSMAELVQPHVVLMDVRMPTTSGTVATARLTAQRSPARVMMLTGSPDGSTMAAAALAGAVGFPAEGLRRAPTGQRRSGRRRRRNRLARAGCRVLTNAALPGPENVDAAGQTRGRYPQRDGIRARITLHDDRCRRASHARAGARASSRDPRCGAAPSRAISLDFRIGRSWRCAS